MRLVCISDTHNRHRKISIPYGDVLIHAGDFCGVTSMAELKDFNDWLGSLPHKYKIFVPGNHDVMFERIPLQARAALTNATCLIDEAITIENIRFYGSPWQPEFFDWAFNLPRGPELADKWKRIPDNTQVLITHGPPKGVLDQCPDIRSRNPRIRQNLDEIPRVSVGCADLKDRIDNLPDLLLHIFGHVHTSAGTTYQDGVQYVNAAICTEKYKPDNPPRVIEFVSR